MRVVFDTNVLVAAMRSPSGASAALIEAVEAGRITLIANTALFVEYEAVLTRSEHLAAAGVTQTDVGQALDALARFIVRPKGRRRARPYVRDRDDDMVLEAAINGSADVIVTFETRTFSGVEDLGVAVMTPGAFWAKLQT